LTKYDGERAAEVNPVQTMTSPALAYEPVQVVSDGVKLAGVFTRPRGLAGRLPAVLFLSDSGKHDRDGVAPTANLNLGTGRALDHLCQATGFAVLRMDDRNTGESEGDIPQNSLSVQANDAANLLDFLKKRPDVDPQRLAIIGHGEGANVAIMVAAKRPDLKAAVLLAPSDVPFSELMEEVVKTRHSADGGDPDGWKRSPILTILSHARQSDKKTVVLGGRPVYLDYYREWFAMKPVDDLRQTSARILHVQGGKDLQVYPKHAEGFRRALGGDKRYTFRQFDNLNHLFRPSKGTLGEYADPTATIDPAFVDYVAAWLQASL
jgi:pimeloyl-ACP methyl ester carboxylesterase